MAQVVRVVVREPGRRTGPAHRAPGNAAAETGEHPPLGRAIVGRAALLQLDHQPGRHRNPATGRGRLAADVRCEKAARETVGATRSRERGSPAALLALQLELCLPRLVSSPAPGGLDRRTSSFQPESWPQGQSQRVYSSEPPVNRFRAYLTAPNEPGLSSAFAAMRVPQTPSSPRRQQGASPPSAIRWLCGASRGTLRWIERH